MYNTACTPGWQNVNGKKSTLCSQGKLRSSIMCSEILEIFYHSVLSAIYCAVVPIKSFIKPEGDGEH